MPSVRISKEASKAVLDTAYQGEQQGAKLSIQKKLQAQLEKGPFPLGLSDEEAGILAGDMAKAAEKGEASEELRKAAGELKQEGGGEQQESQWITKHRFIVESIVDSLLEE